MILTTPVPVVGINSACVSVTCIYQFFIGIIIRFGKKISVVIVCIESLVKKLTSEHLAWCATLCDFDVYLNRVIEDCEKWEMYEITLMELVDSAVRFMVLQDGFAELSCYVGDDVLSMEEFFAQDEKQFALSDGFRYLVRNECDRRYDFDSRFDDDVEDV